MAKQKDPSHLSASDIAVILSYILEISISASDVYIALLQLELVTKDFKTREWIPTEKGKEFAEERPYTDKRTNEEKTFFVWHRDIVEILKERFDELKIGGNYARNK